MENKPVQFNQNLRVTKLVLFLIAVIATLSSCQCSARHSVIPQVCGTIELPKSGQPQLNLVSCEQVVHADPLFVRNPGTWGAQDLGDLHLRADSPAINIGDPARCTATDLEGKAHVGICDAGVYEYQGAIVEASAQQINTAPNAPAQARDDQVQTIPNMPLFIRPLLNDDNPDVSPLQIISATQPAHGALSLLADTFIYTPTTNYEGTDSFRYTVQDGNVRTQATVTIRIASLAFLYTEFQQEVSGGNPLAVAPGSLVTYTVGVYNAPFGLPATNVQLTSTLPSGLTFSKWITQTTAESKGNTVTLQLSSLPTNTLALIQYTAQVGSDSTLAGADLANVLNVRAANADRQQATAWLRVAAITEYKILLPVISK